MWALLLTRPSTIRKGRGTKKPRPCALAHSGALVAGLPRSITSHGSVSMISPPRAEVKPRGATGLRLAPAGVMIPGGGAPEGSSTPAARDPPGRSAPRPPWSVARPKPSERRDPAQMGQPAYDPEMPVARRDLADAFGLVILGPKRAPAVSSADRNGIGPTKFRRTSTSQDQDLATSEPILRPLVQSEVRGVMSARPRVPETACSLTRARRRGGRGRSSDPGARVADATPATRSGYPVASRVERRPAP